MAVAKDGSNASAARWTRTAEEEEDKEGHETREGLRKASTRALGRPWQSTNPIPRPTRQTAARGNPCSRHPCRPAGQLPDRHSVILLFPAHATVSELRAADVVHRLPRAACARGLLSLSAMHAARGLAVASATASDI